MKILFTLLVVFFAMSMVNAQVYPMDTVKFINPNVRMPGHPRILLLAGEEKRIIKSIKSNPVWQEVHATILHQCDSLITEAPVERVLFGVRLLAKSRACLYRVFNLSYAWRMTGDKKYFDRAEKELLAVSAFSDWNPSHYLDVAEMTMAVAIGYDWLYNDLSEKSRSIIREAILTKGIATSYDKTYPNYRKWLSVTNNWNQVCNAGMTYGALAIYENNPQLAQKVINRSIASIEIPMKDYGPDGAFAEGYTYWGYGTTFNIMFLSAIEKLFKTDFGLSQQKGFLKTAGYLENVVGPTGKCFNYSDASEVATLQPAMFWFAKKQNDLSLLWQERKFLSGPQEIRKLSDRLLPTLLIWGEGVDINKIPAPKTKIWSGGGKNPVALMRSSWTDPAAIFVGIKGGSPSVTHGHMDVGSFVMESDGVRWAMDFGMQEYTALELKNIDLWEDKQDGQRWKIFRYNNFAHNTLTVNNELQKVTGRAPLSGTTDRPGFLSAATDISSLYKGYLSKALRGIAICNDQYVLIRDEIETLSEETTIRWSMVTGAEVKITGTNTAELTKNGKRLTLMVGQPAGVKITTWSTEPPMEYDDKNPGTTMVGFEIKIPAKTKSAFDIFMVPDKAQVNKDQPVPDIANWPKP